MKTSTCNFTLKALLLLMLLCLGNKALSHDFEVDGIYYNIDGDEVSVTYRGTNSGQYPNEYSADVIIPSSVTWMGKTYSVTSIGDSAFYESQISSISIPETITRIGDAAFYCDKLSKIKCLATVPPEMSNSFCQHNEGLPIPELRASDYYSEFVDYVDINHLLLYVHADSYFDYKAFNETYHFFSYIICVDGDKTETPSYSSNKTYSSFDVSFSPSEESRIFVVCYYTDWGTTDVFFWGETDGVSVSAQSEIVESYYEVMSFAIAEGKMPSDTLFFSGKFDPDEFIPEDNTTYDFRKNGVCYNILNDETVEVTYGRYYADCEEYSYYEGDVVIPESANDVIVLTDTMSTGLTYAAVGDIVPYTWNTPGTMLFMNAKD